ncbi:MAG: C4-type zinc ribbon domain-containing protein [Clostridiales bacterium]|jgi:predicted  nucleic acid-binding Zn-ribbon protein|nr:C4-type zinc ribbon domain-containing protein [Clostridiales bacterium]
MPNADALWEYQAAELSREALEREILNTPARNKFNKLHAFLTEQQNAITHLKKEIAKRQAGLEKLQEQADALARDIELEHSEFQNMQKDDECTATEITECRENHEKLLKCVSGMQKDITALIDWLLIATKDYKKTRQKASAAKKEYDELRAICEREYTDSADARAKADKELEARAALVDPQLMERYHKVKRNHQTPMAKLLGDRCGGCNMSLPMVVVKRVQGGNAIVECENCGRILYAG